MKNLIKVTLMIAAMTGFIGCTTERQYDTIYKDDRTETLKSLILSSVDGSPQRIMDNQDHNTVAVVSGEDWLYVPSTVNITRTTSATIPYYMGEARRVRLAFTKENLKVLEVESDQRFSNNLANHKPILSIPVSHIDYKCQEDANGRCLNREEKDSDISWEKKKYFQVKVGQMATQNINFLPVEFDNLFFPCHTEVGSDFIDYKAEKNAINIQIEKTYKSNLRCAGNIESLKDLTFTVRYHYSFVRLSSVSTGDYQPLTYSKNDENNFGFFTSRLHQLDTDNSDIEGSEKFLFKRWNPNMNITYTLSESFNEPQFKKIKDATVKAVSTINTSLSQSGSKIRIDLKSSNEKLHAGDIRNNMIVLVNDPQASGIIGYGPSAANPATGEILHARTVMFLGTMKKFIKRNYDEYIEAIISERTQNEAKSKGITQLTIHPNLVKQEEPTASIEVSLKVSEQVKDKLSAANRLKHAIKTSKIAQVQSHIGHNHDFMDPHHNHHHMHDHVKNPAKFTEMSNDIKKKVEFLSSINAYPAELFNFQSAFSADINELVEKLNFKPWIELDESEKSLVVDTLLPHVWIPTLVHELGHNLGLRHNFSGSEDKENFYSQEELAQMGVKGDFAYSSVMDYAYRTTNELPVMGKYDIAALKYGYAERVDIVTEVDGQPSTQEVSLAEYRANPELKIKQYGFCTDEHVSANPNCNRFDEGTDLTEIALHYIQAYEDRYELANKRYKRRNFSLYDDPYYVFGINRIFKSLRLIFERHENIVHTFGVGENDDLWNEIPFLTDLKQATNLSAAFFLSVVKTSDTLCAIATKDNPGMIIAALPIRDLSPFAVSCFDSQEVQLRDPYIVVAEGGKSFQSRKAPNNPNSYMDQIDVRGIWADKLLALHYLTSTKLNSPLFDKYTDNYLDLSIVQPAFKDLVTSVFQDKVVGAVVFKDIYGQALLSANLDITFTDDLVAKQTHRLLSPLSSYVRKMMNLDNDETSFQKEFASTLHRNLSANISKGSYQNTMGLINVFDEKPQNGLSKKHYGIIEIGNERLFTKKDSTVSIELFNGLKDLRIIEVLTAETIKSILDDLVIVEGIEDSQNLTDEQQAATDRVAQRTGDELKVQKLGKNKIENYMNGKYKSQSFYESMILALAGKR